MKRGGEFEPQAIWTIPSQNKIETLPPDYLNRWRLQWTNKVSVRADLQQIEMMLCKRSVVYWINTWCFTYDPDLPEGQRDIPMNLFAIQMEFILWLEERLETAQRTRRPAPGLCEKSRRMGASFLAIYFALNKWLFSPGFAAGFGSLKLEEVDELGNMDSLFEKARYVLRNLPKWMLPTGFDELKHATSGKIINPSNGASIVAEGGKNMGRGGRKSIFFVDEAAHLSDSDDVDSSLAATTNCRIDISTPHGAGGPFWRRRHGGNVSVFRMHWRDDPRVDEAWAASKKLEIGPVNFAEQYDIDYAASLPNIAIPARFVEAAVNLVLPKHLDDDGNEIPDTSPKVAGLDCSGEGANLTVLISRRGPYIDMPVSWQGLDTTQSAHKAMLEAEKLGVQDIMYDVSGLGIGYKSAWKASDVPTTIRTHAINSGLPPTETKWPDGKWSKELFANMKAEFWWMLRTRFEKAYEYKNGLADHPADEMISIPAHGQLIAELSAPVYETLNTGKKQMESKKDMRKRGIASPDFADALVLCCAQMPKKKAFVFWG